MKAGWSETTIGEIARIARGGSPRPIQKYLTKDPDGINWIKIGDATKSGKYIYETEEKIIPEGVARSRLVKEGDFLLSNSMSFGRPYIMRTKGCIHDGWLVLSPDLKRVDQDFLYHLLGAPQVFAQFDLLAAGSTVRNLNTSLVSTVRIPLPPLDEQKRIVAVLDEAFEGLSRARANAEANLADARELFRRCLEVDFVKLAETQPRRTIGEVATIKGGKRLPKGDKLVPTKTPFPYISIKDFNDYGSVDVASIDYLLPKTREAIKNYIIRADDLYISIAGTIGKTGIVPAELDGANLTENAARMVFNDGIYNEYVYYFTLTDDFQNQAGLNTRTAAQPKLALERLKTISLPVAPPTVQIEMAERFRSIREQSQTAQSSYRTKVQAIDTLRQSLLQKAFSGELT